jgi:hypothetical protein
MNKYRSGNVGDVYRKRRFQVGQRKATFSTSSIEGSHGAHPMGRGRPIFPPNRSADAQRSPSGNYQFFEHGNCQLSSLITSVKLY